MPGKKERPVIVFDLDDTICFPNHDAKDTASKYGRAKKNLDVISRMRLLHRKGYYIIIHSARRMLTHDGDLDKIHEDVWDVTVDWLERAQVPYDELVFGKPYANTYYVDDKAMNLDMFKEWADDELRYR
jgi:capsule biosynthesis phosphatase